MADKQGVTEELEFQEKASRQRVYVRTFGCQMNEYDTEKMLQLLSPTHELVSEPENAHLVIVNTCSVREKGEHKLFSLLGELRELKNKNPELVIGVSGCVAQQEGTSILKRNRAVDFVVGTHNLSLVPALVKSAAMGAAPQVAVDYREEWEDLPVEFDAIPVGLALEAVRGATVGTFYTPIRAMVAIQRGCNKHCSFCVVPHTRGPETSRSADEIEREVRLKVRAGAREVLLLGQTVNSYGRDFIPRYPFERLIDRLSQIDKLERIRFISPHPAEVRPEFVKLFSSNPKLCPHIHLPLQSGSDRILKLMNRNYRVRRYLEIVNELRSECPNIAISTDIIVGFPTETEEDFLGTLSVMEEVKWSFAFSFVYSPRPNTTAGAVYTADDEVKKSIADERLARLKTRQNELTLEFNEKFIGQTVEVLVEGPTKKISSLMNGRTPQNILVELDGEGLKAGDLVNAQVFSASPGLLRASALNDRDKLAQSNSNGQERTLFRGLDG